MREEKNNFKVRKIGNNKEKRAKKTNKTKLL